MDPASAAESPPVPNNHDDIAPTKAALNRLESHLRHLDEEVSKLQGRLGELGWQKKALKRHISLRDSLNAPIHRLFPSLVREMFCYCLPFGRNPAMNNQEAPILLGQVCSQWRQIAHSTPELWAAIHIPLPAGRQTGFASYANRKHEAVRLQGIASWLSRSRDLPLSISLTAGDLFAPAISTKMVLPYLKLLSSFSPRWRLVYFHVPGFDWIQHFFSRYKASDLPLLEKLHIDGSRCNTSKFTRAGAMKALSREDSFLYCPKLRWISLPLLGELIIEAPVQWSQITVLNLNGACSCSLFQIMHTLSLCPNLLGLSVCFDISSSSADLSLEQTVSLPHLYYLCVVDHCTSFDSVRFFNHLCAPSLRCIAYDRYPPSPWLSHIITPESLSPKLFRALESFISKARQPVEELSLQYDWLIEGDLFRFLSLLPDLRRLSLRGNGRSTKPSFFTDSLPQPLLFDDMLFENLLIIPDKKDIVIITKDVSDRGSLSIGEDSNDSDDNDGFSRPVGITRLSDCDEGGEVWQETYNFFCPKLQILQCTGAMFSGDSILKFVRSRACPSKRFGISRVRGVDISFPLGVEKPSDDLLNEIKALAEENGISLFLHFMPWTSENTPMSFPQTSSDGLHAVGFRMNDASVFSAVF